MEYGLISTIPVTSLTGMDDVNGAVTGLCIPLMSLPNVISILFLNCLDVLHPLWFL